MTHPRYKDTGGSSWFGEYLYQQMVPEDHPLRALKELFDWQELAGDLIRLYEGQGLVGRPPYDPVLMFKMLFASYLYELSERDTEVWANESIPAHYFFDLALDRRAPDNSTLSLFKQRLVSDGSWEALSRIFDRLLGQARERGLEMGSIQIVDSVHTQADVNRQKDQDRPPRDPDARVVNKGDRTVVEPGGQSVTKAVRYQGYKTHASVNVPTGITTSVLPSLGDSADNKAFPKLFQHDLSLQLPTETYGGDRAYDDTAIYEYIEGQRMHVGIRLRDGRIAKKDANKERWLMLVQTPQYQAATKVRYRVEQVFGQAKDKHGLERCRYLGLVRFGIQSFLTFMVVNAKRMIKLLTGITLRKQAKGRRREMLRPVYASLPWA